MDHLPTYWASGLLLLVAACREPPSADFSVVYGPWATSDARYEGRFFELSADELVLGLGEEGSEICRIGVVERAELDPDTDRYDVSYVLPNGEAGVFSFEHSRTNDFIQFSNQKGLLWNRGRP